MNGHGLGLADPVGAVVALVFDCRVPPPAQMDDIVGGDDQTLEDLWRINIGSGFNAPR
jgi:hypothetical protein